MRSLQIQSRLSTSKLLDSLRTYRWPFVALLVIILVWLAAFAELDISLRNAKQSAFDDATKLSHAYSSYLTQLVNTVDQVLHHVQLEWELTQGKLKLETLRERGLFPSEYIFHIGITDTKGNLVTSTVIDSNKTEPLALSDRPYFAVQKTSNADLLYIGTLTMSRTTDLEVIHFSRRLQDQAGNFAGVVFITMTPSYFVRNFDVLALGDKGIIGVIGKDKVVRAFRYGKAKMYNQPVFSAPILKLDADSGKALLGGDVFSDGRKRYTAWAESPSYPLIALVALDEQEMLSSYDQHKKQVLQLAYASTLILSIIGLLGFFLTVKVTREKKGIEALSESYRRATEEAADAFFILRPLIDTRGVIFDYQCADCNTAAAKLYGRAREEIVGAHLSRLIDGRRFRRMLNFLEPAYRLTFLERDIRELSEKGSTPRWLHIKAVRSGVNLAVTVRDTTELVMQSEELRRRENHDWLTGLKSGIWAKRFLTKKIANSLETGQEIAVLLVGLDEFKTINDSMGHATGDALLREAAKRIDSQVPNNAAVARWRGDEFVVILPLVHERRESFALATSLLDTFKQKFTVEGNEISLSASVGICTYPHDGKDATTLLQNTEIALYDAKLSGKRTYRIFDPDLHERLKLRLQWELELKTAIERDQFVMYYQPRMDIQSWKIESMEALVRWKHPTRGTIGPANFISIAEEKNLIFELGELIIGKVCSQIAMWREEGHSPVPVSVNISPRQFNNINIIELLRVNFERYRIDPCLIEVELTESAMAEDQSALFRSISSLREIGVKLALDDFGTGYSSLSQLLNFHFDVLKIDKSFTDKIEKSEEAKSFVAAIVSMAKALKLRVVAEGVESRVQVEILNLLGCNEVQGYLVSKPVPADDIPATLENLRASYSMI